MTFERIVRPFQTVQISPAAQRSIQAPDEELENIVLEFGRDGQVKDVSANSSSSITTYTDDKAKEIDRTVSERRVENPEDPSQYVIVEDTDKITYEKGKREEYKKTELELKKQES